MRFDTGDKAIYVGYAKTYKHTDVEIVYSLKNNTYRMIFCKIKTFDGKEHLVLKSDLMTYEEYYVYGGYENLIGTPPPIPSDCECGAKHTSMPNYHLNYCRLKKEL